MAKSLTGRERVRRWREDRSVPIPLTELARRIGYKGHAALARWEEGKGSLPSWRLHLLSKETGIPVEHLAGEKQAEEIRLIRGRT